jgi:hypothetical protein
MTLTDPNVFLMGGGVKSAAFPTVGTAVSGRIVRAPEVRQQTTPEGQPKTFDNGDPMMQLIVQIATDERDPQNVEDDGVRGVYIKSNMLNAVRDAVRKTGAKGLEVGGTLTVTYIGDGEKKRAAHSAPKLYTASYAPPTAAAANDYLMASNGNGNGGNGHQSVQQATAAVQPAPVGQAPTGIDPTLWAQLSPEQRASVLAASAAVR